MSDLSPETRKLLDMAIDGDRLPPHRRALLESKFFARIAKGAVLGFAAREAWASSPGLFGPIAKGIAGIAIVSSIGAGGYVAMRSSRYEAAPARQERTAWQTPRVADLPGAGSLPATQAIAAPPSVSEPTEPPRRSSPIEPRATARRGVASAPASPTAVRSSRAAAASARGAPSLGRAAAPVHGAPPPSPPPTAENKAKAPAPVEETTPLGAPNTLNDETRILWEADQALRSGHTSRAVTLLDEHAGKYPDGALSPERGAERIVALCKIGHIDAPTVRGYLTSHPNLPLAERIQQACSRILSPKK